MAETPPQVWTNAPSLASPMSAARLNITELRITEAVARLDAIAAAGPFTAIKAALDDGAHSCAIQVIGDSTGIGTTRWPYLLAQQIATDYPAWTVAHVAWDDVAEDYGVPTVIQTGTAGVRMTAPTVGTLPRRLLGSEAPHITGTIDVRAKLKCSSWTPANAFGATTFIGEGGGTGAWGWSFSINTAGVPKLYYSTDGTALGSMSATAVVGFTAGSTGWLRCVFTPDDLAGNRVAAFYTSTDGVAWTQLGATVTTAGAVVVKDEIAAGFTYMLGEHGASTGNGVQVIEVDIRNGTSGPSIVPRRPDLWTEYGSNPNTPVTGAPVLTVVNGSRSGGLITYFNDTTRRQKMTPDYGQLLTFCSTSHNETRAVGNSWASLYKLWVDGIRTRLAQGSVVALTQNPQLTGAAYAGAHARRRLGLLAHAPGAGLGVVDVYQAFLDHGATWTTDLMVGGGDLVHPNSAGSILWRDTVYALLAAG